MRDNTNWIQTFSGGRIWPLDPQPEDVRIEDICHALALQCRFTGHTTKLYSVAQHSVLVSRYCDPNDALWGLLHDASEAYLSDIARPVKKDLRMLFYREAEEKITEAIAERFGLAMPIPESVHRADNQLLMTERRDLLTHVDGWTNYGEPIEEIIVPWSPGRAENEFLFRFHELNERKG